MKKLNEKPKWLEEIVNLPDINTNIKFFGGHEQRVPFEWSAEQETHFAFEIMMIIEGVQRTYFEGRVNDYQKGDIILIPPGTAHENHCYSRTGMEYFCVHFDIDDPTVQQQLLMYCPILLQKDNPCFEAIEKTLSTFIGLLKIGEYTIKDKLLVERLLIELVSDLFEYAEKEKVKIEQSDHTSLVLARSIADTIQDNFKKYTEYPKPENLSLLSMHQVADSLSISKSTMLKVFKKVYSISPKQYLDQLKYNEAKMLLHQPKLSIGEISEIIGYQNIAHFSRQFKKWSGHSPKAYKAQLNRF